MRRNVTHPLPQSPAPKKGAPFRRRFAILSLLVVTGTGCLPISEWEQKAANWFSKTLGFRPVGREQLYPKPSPTPSAQLETHRFINAEFLKELYAVVLQRDIIQNEASEWMNALDQGGSYEGVYNGIVSATEYREKEKGVAPVAALRLYAEMMGRLAVESRFDPLKIRLERLQREQDTGQTYQAEVQPPQPSEDEKKKAIADAAVKAVNKSLYTLKREMGAEALKLMDLKSEYKDKLATWYAHFVLYTNTKGVSFAISGRNSTDLYYHYKWALEQDDQRLRWEVLNRIHRLMNQIN